MAVSGDDGGVVVLKVDEAQFEVEEPEVEEESETKAEESKADSKPKATSATPPRRVSMPSRSRRPKSERMTWGEAAISACIADEKVNKPPRAQKAPIKSNPT